MKERKKDRKKEYRVFTIADWEREQDYLRKRHGEGWKFTGLTYPGVYHFVRCQPEDVVYQLDYNEEGIKHKDEYVRMFRTAAGSTSRIMRGTAISASLCPRCRGKWRKSSAMTSRGWK